MLLHVVFPILLATSLLGAVLTGVNDFIELCLLKPNFADFDETFERLVSLTQTSEAGFDSI